MREDDSEEITKNIKGNLKEDVKSSASKEDEIPQEEEDNLNESSGENEDVVIKYMYIYSHISYKREKN